MNEVEFRNWLLQNGDAPKVAGDYISRLKRIEREINHCDMDEQYRNDKCLWLSELFSNNGKNVEMEKKGTSFPVGKYHMSVYRLAIKKYVRFCDEIISNT